MDQGPGNVSTSPLADVLPAVSDFLPASGTRHDGDPARSADDAVYITPATVPARASSIASALLSAVKGKTTSITTAMKEKTDAIKQQYLTKQPEGTVESTVPVSSFARASHEGTQQDTSSIQQQVYAAAESLGKKTRETSQWAADQLKRLTTPRRRILAVCKQDMSVKPCPQVVLACCTVIAVKGLAVPDIFKAEAPTEKVEWLLSQQDSHMVLPPSDLDPILAACMVKRFLRDLDEPLLLRKLVDRWLLAGADPQEASVKEVLAALPLANLSTLRVLMDTCYRIASQSNLNGMNAHGLAQQLAPVLLWREAESKPVVRAPALPPLPSINMGANVQALKAKLLGVKAASASPDATSPPSSQAGDVPPGISALQAEAATADQLLDVDALDKVDVPPPVSQPLHSLLPAASPAQAVATLTEAAPVVEPDLASSAPAAAAVQLQLSSNDTLAAATTSERQAAGHDATHPDEDDHDDADTPAGAKVPLAGADLGAIVRLIEHLIISYDDLF